MRQREAVRGGAVQLIKLVEVGIRKAAEKQGGQEILEVDPIVIWITLVVYVLAQWGQSEVKAT